MTLPETPQPEVPEPQRPSGRGAVFAMVWSALWGFAAGCAIFAGMSMGLAALIPTRWPAPILAYSLNLWLARREWKKGRRDVAAGLTASLVGIVAGVVAIELEYRADR